MTCIVGFVSGKTVYIGGDSAGVSNYNVRIREDEKVFIKNNIIFGFTSSFRMGQILRYSFIIPEHNQSKSDYEYLCSDFIDSLIDCFKEKGYGKIENNENSGGEFLIGYKGNLYRIDYDFQVAKCIECYDSCGCGEYYALGALKIIDKNKPPIEIIKEALEVAEYYCGGVRGPFNILNL